MRHAVNVLMLTPRLPYPPDRGDKIRSFHELRYLARRHNVFCATLLEPQDDPQAVHLLRCYCRDVAAVPVSRVGRLARALACTGTGRSYTEGYFHSPELARVLAEWGRKHWFDAVLAFSGGMARYAELLPADRRILDLVDVDSAKWRHYGQMSRGWRRVLYDREARRLRARELQWLRRFDATVVINSREAALLQGQASSGRLHVIPNGVALPTGPISATATGPVLGFVGMMNYLPNVDAVLWFARSIWPAVRRQVPEARFIVVGRHPHEVNHTGLDELNEFLPEHNDWRFPVKCLVPHQEIDVSGRSRVAMNAHCQGADQRMRNPQPSEPLGRVDCIQKDRGRDNIGERIEIASHRALPTNAAAPSA